MTTPFSPAPPAPPQLRVREWRHALRISLGWLLNFSAFVALLCIFVVYGCTFRSLAADDNSQVAGPPYIVVATS